MNDAQKAQGLPAFLLGGDAFLEAFARDVAAAETSVMLQAMTFQADRAGKAVFDCIASSKARERHVLIDDYSSVVVSDAFAMGPRALTSPEFRKLVRETRLLPARFRARNVSATITNPIAGRPWRYPARNHKKMAVMDRRIVYLGGMNISDHNFAWFDSMLRIESEQLGALIANDMHETAAGRNRSMVAELEDGRLYFFDGLKSRSLYRELFSSIEKAQVSVTILSPYVSEPLLSVIEQRRNRDVPVTIITPGLNNKSVMKRMLVQERGKQYFRLLEQPHIMSHAKAVCIDGRELWFGSSNFDHISYCFEQEVVLQTTCRHVLEAFNSTLLPAALHDTREIPEQNRPARSLFRVLVRTLIGTIEQIAT